MSCVQYGGGHAADAGEYDRAHREDAEGAGGGRRAAREPHASRGQGAHGPRDQRALRAVPHELPLRRPAHARARLRLRLRLRCLRANALCVDTCLGYSSN